MELMLLFEGCESSILSTWKRNFDTPKATEEGPGHTLDMTVNHLEEFRESKRSCATTSGILSSFPRSMEAWLTTADRTPDMARLS
eukprot:756023-Hanusia_phi.AAC.1